MPVNPIRYTMVRTFRGLEHPQIIAFHIGECRLGCKTSATHLVHECERGKIILYTSQNFEKDISTEKYKPKFLKCGGNNMSV